MCKIWWKVVAACIRWWDDFEWQKSALNVINGIERTHFHVLCDKPLLDGKTTSLTKRNYYAWKICIAGRIWWWDEFKWQKSAPSDMNTLDAPKKCSGEKIYFKIFLRPIRLDSHYGGTSNSRIKKRELSL